MEVLNSHGGPGRDERMREFEQIVGSSRALEAVLAQVEKVGVTGCTVLIEGETGTGKEVIAHAIHNVSPRCGGPFVKLNCAAIPMDLLESELFGHEKGAFTGAIAQKIGRFELAGGGTLFLDEVGDIPLALQPKLLRVLQEREFERLGSGRTHSVDVRLVAATNRDLTQMVNQNLFRSDLYYRLNVFPIAIPPLRQRADDIPALVFHFVNKFSRTMRKPIREVPAETMAAFQSYDWPGNIRELQNLVERAVILADDGVLANPLATSPHRSICTPVVACKPAALQPDSHMSLKDSERALILQALDSAHWVVGGAQGAAARLGLKRTTLMQKIKRLGIQRPAAGGSDTLPAPAEPPAATNGFVQAAVG